MTESLIGRVGAALRDLMPTPAPLLVAVSGGADSIALLDLLYLSQLAHHCPLIVGHVEHGISPDSADAAALATAAATQRGLPFHRADLLLGPGTSETRARDARRTALRQLRREAGAAAVVLAHHADDQAETVLMRVLGGSGVAGLAAMRAKAGIWLRPALQIRRAELAAHGSARGLDWWTDPANCDPRHLRSWIRSELLPAIGGRVPTAPANLLQVATHASADRRAWHQVIGQLPALDLQRCSRGISVAAPVLRDYRSALRKAVLMQLGREVGMRLGRRRVSAVERLLDGPSRSATIAVSARGRVELASGRLALYHERPVPPDPVELHPGAAAHLATAELQVNEVVADAPLRKGWTTDIPAGHYSVRVCHVGDRIRPLGGTGSRAVAVLLREAGVAPSRRARWPVVVNQDDATIVWVPGICRADALVPAKGTQAWRVDCVVT